MIEAEFQPTLFNQGQQVITDDPYVFLEMWVKDHTNQYRSLCINWERSNSDIYTWKRNGATLVGLSSYKSLTTGYITTNKSVDETGTYWILLRTLRQPWQGNKTISLTIDGTLVGSANTYHQTEHYRYIDFGHIDLTSGNHAFRVDFDGKDSWVDHLILYKLDYYSSEETKSSRRLDWNNIEFTQNTIGDINTADITLPLRTEWNAPNRNIHSRMVFDRTDMLNIILGDSPDNIGVRFGGYLLGHSKNDELTQLTLHFADTLMDLYRQPNYANYAIGITPSSDNTYTFPITQFGSAFEAIRHLSDTQEWGIHSYGVTYPYKVYKNFKNPSDFNSVTSSGFEKTLAPSIGMKVEYGKVAVDSCGVTPDLNCQLTLFDSPSSPVDAINDNILYLKYFATGESCSKTNQVQFNIELTMYRDGEGPGDVETYNILCNGKAGESNVIGQESPTLDGKDQMIKFDLKKAFNNFANSGHYYITKVRITDTITSAQQESRTKSALFFIEFGLYSEDVNKSFELAQETSYPYENLAEILTKLGYVGYVDYARRRGLDVLCVSPEMNIPANIEAVSGVNARLTDITYDTQEDLRNAKLAHFKYKIGEDEYTGVSYAENSESVLSYGPGAWGAYESYSDINNQTDSDLETRRYVEQNSYCVNSFTLELYGCPLLNPANYIVSRLDNEYLGGNYPTKTVTYTLNREQSPKCIARVSVNRPGSYYNQLMDKLDKNLKKYVGIENRRQYDSRSLNNMDFISPGAFIREGY